LGQDRKIEIESGFGIKGRNGREIRRGKRGKSRSSLGRFDTKKFFVTQIKIEFTGRKVGDKFSNIFGGKAKRTFGFYLGSNPKIDTHFQISG